MTKENLSGPSARQIAVSVSEPIRAQHEGGDDDVEGRGRGEGGGG